MITNTIPGVTLTNNELYLLATANGIEPAALKAVQIVETGGRSGFITKQHPTILFEGHIFWQQLKRVGIAPKRYVKGREDILYPKWDKTKYLGGVREYGRLHAACAINTEAAYRSTSWGMFQILGINYGWCGELTITEFVKKMTYSEYHQLMLAINFMRNSGLLKLLAKHDWIGFARHYNGTEYAKNRYAQRLAEAYKTLSKGF
jgi:hypothetical protein